MKRVNGLHHITAIAGPAQENLDFYAGVLGMRLVKKSVNQDDPGTYHLFYADAEGRPARISRFFPWSQLAPPRRDTGLRSRSASKCPHGSLPIGAHGWKSTARVSTRKRRASASACSRWPIRTACGSLSSKRLTSARPFTPWEDSPVAAERQIRGLHSGTSLGAKRIADRRFLTGVLGFERLGTENGWTRYGFKDAWGASMSARLATSDAARGASAPSTISPGAWTTRSTSWRSAGRSRGPARAPRR